MEFVEYSGCIHVAGGLNRQSPGDQGAEVDISKRTSQDGTFLIVTCACGVWRRLHGWDRVV